MKIVKLETRNVQRIKAIEITPDGNVFLGGKNGQGKSSILDSITYGVGGKRTYSKDLIRDGEDSAVIKFDIEKYIITRTINRDKPDKLEITTTDGVPIKSSEAFLKDLCGSIGLAFDPSEFVRETPSKQLQTLKDIVGLDFAELDTQRAAIFAERTQVNGWHKKHKSMVEGLAKYPDAPEKEISNADLMVELEKAMDSHEIVADKERDLESMRNDLVGFDNRKADIEESIEQVQEDIKEFQERVKKAEEHILSLKKNIKENTTKKSDYTKKCKTAAAELEELKKAVIDVEPIKAKIAGAGDINTKVRANNTYDEAKATAAEYKQQSDELTAKLDKIDADKAAQLTAAKFPVEGLSFDSEGVLLNGRSFGVASQAERIRVSVAIAAALNPKLRIALIRDGSLLDEDSMKVLVEAAKEADMQLWLEVVTSNAEDCSIFIEDGSIV